MKNLLITLNSTKIDPDTFASEQRAAVVRTAKKLGSKNVPLAKLVASVKKNGLKTVGQGGVEASVKYHLNLLRKEKLVTVRPTAA